MYPISDNLLTVINHLGIFASLRVDSNAAIIIVETFNVIFAEETKKGARLELFNSKRRVSRAL